MAKVESPAPHPMSRTEEPVRLIGSRLLGEGANGQVFGGRESYFSFSISSLLSFWWPAFVEA